MASRAVKSLAQRVFRRVHPDLFQRWPSAQAANQRAMQDLNQLLETAEEQRAARPAPPATSPRELLFYVHAEQEAEPPREVSARWWPPSGPASSASRRADQWDRSSENVLTALLRQIDPSFVADQPSAPMETPSRAAEDAAASADPFVRAAAAAAERRRRGHDAGPSDERGAPPPPHAALGGGELQPELLFFHELPGPEARSRATARLAGLMAELLGAGQAHGPLMVCGGRPPAAAHSRGFACVTPECSLEELRASLEAARRTSGGAASAARRADGRAALSDGAQLCAILRCEGVLWGEELGAAAARPITASLRHHAGPLRAALDGPWRGVWIELRPAAAAGPEALPPCELIDGADGGCTLLVRGEAGAAAAAGFLRGEWRAVRHAQERHALLGTLRDRVGCAAAHATGVADVAAAQVGSLRGLLRLLAGTPVLLPGAAAEGLASAALRFGGAESSLSAGGAGQASQAASQAAREAARLSARRGLREVSLPSDAEPAEALAVLLEAARRDCNLRGGGGGPGGSARAAASRGRGGGRGSRERARKRRGRGR